VLPKLKGLNWLLKLVFGPAFTNTIAVERNFANMDHIAGQTNREITSF